MTGWFRNNLIRLCSIHPGSGSTVKNLKRGRLFAGIVGAATVAILTLATPDAVADTYTSPQTGTHTGRGAILDQYRALGQSAGPLGFPTTNELPTPRVFGRYNLFQNGAMYWSPPSGAHAIGGAIWQTWGALGWENSFLGFLYRPMSCRRQAVRSLQRLPVRARSTGRPVPERTASAAPFATGGRAWAGRTHSSDSRGPTSSRFPAGAHRTSSADRFSGIPHAEPRWSAVTLPRRQP